MHRRVVGLTVAVAVSAMAVFAAVALSSKKPPEHGYVSSAMRVPTTNTEARALGRDFNHDGEGDNRLGQFFAALASQGIDLQGALSTNVADGDLLMLHSLRTPSLSNAKHATWQVLYAEPTESPDFSGSGSFTVAGDPHSAKFPAKVKKRHVTTAAGTIPVQLTAGSGLFTLELTSAKVYATCSKTGCTGGRINGVVTTQQLNTTLIPKLAEQFTVIVARDCPGPGPSCSSGSYGQQLQSLFDTNDDLTISAEELRTSPLAQAVLAPDLDLRKANGKPGQDGKPDALSAGIGFEAVSGRLVRH
ncbi:MAG: hypothetical protein U0R51_04290 [Solirubrobacterales bacterium]